MHQCLFFHFKWLRINYCVGQAGRINGLVACKVANFTFFFISLIAADAKNLENSTIN